uniref:Uncharacterized protein n=1 Tax=Physcomitrium patens TaxID=3218 RepID=A0A2K1JPL4_PHYPA|nr:hypothetical protein PHYPA_015866 [Physcomitrium patens]
MEFKVQILHFEGYNLQRITKSILLLSRDVIFQEEYITNFLSNTHFLNPYD